MNFKTKYFHSVEVILDDQCEVTWIIPTGVEPNPLLQTTGFLIDQGHIDIVGGPDGKEFSFEVHFIKSIL